MAAVEQRDARLLDAAFGVFAHYGFRKASMDDIARAAQISRQGLYLRHPTKEMLFRAVVRHVLERGLRNAEAALAADKLTLPLRLTRAFDAWYGGYIGMFGGDAADLIEASQTLMGSEFNDPEAPFVTAVAAAIEDSGLRAAYGAERFSASQLARTLQATAHGLKHSSATRKAFIEDFGVAAAILCAPLSRRPQRKDR